MLVIDGVVLADSMCYVRVGVQRLLHWGSCRSYLDIKVGAIIILGWVCFVDKEEI